MKLIAAQPGRQRFQWELEILLTNLRQLNDFNLEVVLLFSREDPAVPDFFRRHYPEVGVHTYPDTRSDRLYVSTVRPFLWQQYLKADYRREQDDYLYVDSDIIFREWLDLSQIPADPNTWAASECLRRQGGNYINYDYIASCDQGEVIAARMAEICGITLEQVKAAPGVGAQWVMKHPTVEYWERVQRDCEELYAYLERSGSDIQIWVADMWAHLFGAIREGKRVEMSPELAFCVSTDPVERYDEVKILHNAGVLPENAHDMFFKSEFRMKSPLRQDWSHIRRDKATLKYVEAMNDVTIKA